MTERYVKVSELGRLAKDWECDSHSALYGEPYREALAEAAAELRSLIASAQPREPLDVDELAQFIRTTDGNHTMGAGALAESIVGFLAKRHERGEE